MSFDDIGLDVTIQKMLDHLRLSCSNRINIHFNTEGDLKLVSPVIGITLIRLIEEACNNSIKHAQASDIYVSLISDEKTITLSIKDNGVGFDEEEIKEKKENGNATSGFGMSIMKERVYLLSGEIEIHSVKGVETEVFISIPQNSDPK
jgi:two-component system sensor histidine kinase DegS